MLKRLLLSFISTVMLAAWANASAGETQVIWDGHATVESITPKGTVLMIAPWLDNPKNPHKDEKPLESLKRVDYVLLTHAHNDHCRCNCHRQADRCPPGGPARTG